MNKPLYKRKFQTQLLFLLAFLSSSIINAAQAPDYSNFIGTYEGVVLNGGAYNPIVTTLLVTYDGRLRGEYKVDNNEGGFEGALSNPRIVDDFTVSFEWTDKDGEGYEVLEFSREYKSFNGFWSNRDSEEQFMLTGRRK